MNILLVSDFRMACGTEYGVKYGLESLGYKVLTFETQHYDKATLSRYQHYAYNMLPLQDPFNLAKKMNAALFQKIQATKPALTLFYNTKTVNADAVHMATQYGRAFAYFVDDMFNPQNQSFTFFDVVPIFDCIFTTKSYNVPEFTAIGAKEVLFVNNAYAPDFHRRLTLTSADLRKYSGDVAFIGTFWPERADLFAELIKALPGVRFNIWGQAWQKMRRINYWLKPQHLLNLARIEPFLHTSALWGDDMSRALQSNKINLGLLYKGNRDVQTHRTMEIPACGGFMLAERTEEHQALFEEGKEAAYFSSVDELIAKIKYYLAHEDERQHILEAGYQRCQTSPYTYHDRARQVMQKYAEFQQPGSKNVTR